MRKRFKGFTKPIGRLCRWSMLGLFIYFLLMNVHITIELNKPSGFQSAMNKVSWLGKTVKFIRSF